MPMARAASPKAAAFIAHSVPCAPNKPASVVAMQQVSPFCELSKTSSASTGGNVAPVIQHVSSEGNFLSTAGMSYHIRPRLQILAQVSYRGVQVSTEISAECF